MNCERLYAILADTTQQLRKGPEIVQYAAGPLQVAEINAMPHASEADANLVKVDMELLVIGVDKAKAERHRKELIEILRTYPNPEELRDGPSYIHVGAAIGDQGAAFQLFALGKVLGLWEVITPKKLGLPSAMAGTGFVMITGFREQR